MSDPTIRLLCDLVAINSVNPTLVPGGAGEAEIAAAVAAELHAIGADVEVTDVAPGRPNVVGVLEGREQGPSLMLCAHLDTVGVQGMSAPFDPTIRDGRLYGRGAMDMKGGLAAMIGALRTIALSGGLTKGKLILAAVADEEYGSLGAEALVKTLSADAAVIGEPTGMEIATCHKGFAWVEVTVEGRAAHGSRPGEGRDAILRMGRVLQRLEALDRQLQSQPPHPLLGTASLHASLINGGRELSTYPDRCLLQMERRTLSHEKAETALAEVAEILAELKREDAEFKGEAHLMFGRPPYEIPSDHQLPRMMEEACRRAGRPTRSTGMPFWTDAAILGEAGIPTVIFGPGGEGLHGLEEYVLIEDVLSYREVLVRLAQDFFARQ
jgi:acetylornithine deacetylase